MSCVDPHNAQVVICGCYSQAPPPIPHRAEQEDLFQCSDDTAHSTDNGWRRVGAGDVIRTGQVGSVVCAVRSPAVCTGPFCQISTISQLLFLLEGGIV